MNTYKTKKILLSTLILTVLLTLINTLIGNAVIWYIVDALLIAVPLVYTFTLRKSAKGGTLVAVLLWIPALVVIYMGTQNLLSMEHQIWTMTNMYELLVYGYLIGTGLNICGSCDRNRCAHCGN